MNGKGHAAPRAVNDRRAVSRIVCGEIDNERRPHKATIPRQKKVTRWRAGTCRICGEWSSYISQDHAHRSPPPRVQERGRNGPRRCNGLDRVGGTG